MSEKYEIIKELNQGSMGVIYLAQDRASGELVALKTLINPQHDTALIARFEREIFALKEITHENVISIVDCGYLSDGTLYLVTPWLKGMTLKQYFREQSLNEKSAVNLTFQLLGGASAAHEKGIVHRDLKPSNIVLVPTETQNREYQLYILDFGVAKLIGGNQQTLTATGKGIGSLNYMAPEQAVEAKYVDERSDVYALGLILYELFTGQHPIAQIPNYNPVMPHNFLYPTQINPHLSHHVEAVILKALSASFEMRFSNAYDMLLEFTKAVYC